MKKNRTMKYKIVAFMILITIPLSTVNAFAATKSDDWNYSSYSHGYYVPLSGSMTVKTYTESSGKALIETHVTMNFSSTNASRIALYNEGSKDSKVHEKCRGVKTYLTCDVSSVRKSGFKDFVNAKSVTSNLPNPKYDIENDNPATATDVTGDYYNEESETVALGKITNKSYYMNTIWDDWRNSTSGAAGKFQCQYGMSKKGLIDYNTVITSDVIQSLVSYSSKKGAL